MQEIIKNSFNIFKNNLIIITPLFLYMFFVMTALAYIVNKSVYFPSKIILIFSIIFLTIAFTAGLFFVIKYFILSYNPKDSKDEINIKSIQNFKKFFEGVGGNFLKTTGMYIILTIVFVVLITLSYKFCLHFFEFPEIIKKIYNIKVDTSQTEIINNINSISHKKILIFSYLIFLFNLLSIAINFLGILYFAVNFFEETNIFKSIWQTIKFLFSNFIECILLIIIMFGIFIFIIIFASIFGVNIISPIISLLLIAMYLNYFIILVFYFYNEKKNNSNNRTEFIG